VSDRYGKTNLVCGQRKTGPLPSADCGCDRTTGRHYLLLLLLLFLFFFFIFFVFSSFVTLFAVLVTFVTREVRVLS
jgi:hypothetical protein